MDHFLNPYNFVSIPPKPKNLSTNQKHLLWRCPPPPHDRYTGISGRITCEIHVRTPLFVSDSVNIEPDPQNPDHLIYHFFNINGESLIPASSLRGSIRSVFEAVTNSSLSIFNESETPLFYRMLPEKALGLVPAIVEMIEIDGKMRLGLRLLTGMYDLQVSSKNLYAAWIPKYPNQDRLNHLDERKHRHVLNKSDLVNIPENCRDMSECWGAIRKTTKRDKGFPHYQVDFIHKNRQEVDKWIKNHANNHTYKSMPGYVYQTGLNIDLKQYERFFFYDPQKKREYATLSEAVAETYNELLKDYHNRQEEIKNSLFSQSVGTRRLKPSEFIRSRSHWQLTHGSLVYAQLEKTPQGYNAVALYPVNVSRTAYQHAIKALLNTDKYRHALPCTDINELCLASRVFGWVRSDADKSDLKQRVAYAGRVQFSHATLDEQRRNIWEDRITLSILGSPHPTAIEFYLDGLSPQQIKPQKDKPHGYDVSSAHIKGRKFYRHHPQGVNERETIAREANKFNRSIKGMVMPESIFHFTVDFQNLEPVELGALLWVLELPNEWHHRLGYGKPLGLGSVEIRVIGVHRIDTRQRYWVDGNYADEAGWTEVSKSDLQKEFSSQMQALYGTPLLEMEHIKELDILLSGSNVGNLPIHYPRLSPDLLGEQKNFEWFMQNKKSNHPSMLRSPLRNEDLPYNP